MNVFTVVAEINENETTLLRCFIKTFTEISTSFYFYRITGQDLDPDKRDSIKLVKMLIVVHCLHSASTPDS